MKASTKRLIVPKLKPFDFEHCRVCGKRVGKNAERYARRHVQNPACSGDCMAKERLQSYACCEKAVVNECNCHFSTICPDHGRRCHGSHD